MIKYYIIFLFATFIISCKKATYCNLKGTWDHTETKFNGSDVPLLGSTWVLEFKKKYEGHYTLNGDRKFMDWELNKDEQILRMPNIQEIYTDFNVLEKRGKKLRIGFTDSSNNFIEYIFIKR